MFLFVVVFISACSGPHKQVPNACVVNTDCGGDTLCIQGDCSSVSCYYSRDCDYGEYCDALGECIAGCEEESDCEAGEYCENGLCEPMVCTETALDCLLGEWCNEGECQEPDFPLCDSCSFTDWQTQPNVGGECVIYTFDLEQSCIWPDSSSCPEHWTCFPSDATGENPNGFCAASFWYMDCHETLACPRGFNCTAVFGEEDPMLCWEDCEYYIVNGYLE